MTWWASGFSGTSSGMLGLRGRPAMRGPDHGGMARSILKQTEQCVEFGATPAKAEDQLRHTEAGWQFELA